jgi:hypothetical protein
MEFSFQNIESMKAYQWDDYFDVPMSKETIRNLFADVNEKIHIVSNILVSSKAPWSIRKSYRFIKSGQCRFIYDCGSLFVKENEFFRIDSGRYRLDIAEGYSCEIITLLLLSDIAKD